MVTTLETGTLPSPPPFRAGGGRRLRAAAGMQSRWGPALSPEGEGPSRADVGTRQDRISSPSASGATSTGPDEREGVKSPPQPALRATTTVWLPPRAFLPPDTPRPLHASGQRGIRHRGQRPGRATLGASAQATRRGTARRRSTT